MVKTLIALTPYLAMWNVEQNLRAEPESLAEGMSQHWSLAEAGGKMGCQGCCSRPGYGRWYFLTPGSSRLDLPHRQETSSPIA